MHGITQARVAVLKKPVARPAQQLKQLLHAGNESKSAPEQRLMGSRTLAKLANALPTPPTGATLGAAMRPMSGAAGGAEGAASPGSASSWFSKVGTKVGGLWGRATATSAAADAGGDVEKGGEGERAASGRVDPFTAPALKEDADKLGPCDHAGAGDGAEEWVVLNSPGKGTAGNDGSKGCEATQDALQIRAILEEKRLPCDVLLPRLQLELGVHTCEDLRYLKPEDLDGLKLPPVLARKMLELIQVDAVCVWRWMIDVCAFACWCPLRFCARACTHTSAPQPPRLILATTIGVRARVCVCASGAAKAQGRQGGEPRNTAGGEQGKHRVAASADSLLGILTVLLLLSLPFALSCVQSHLS